MCERVSECMCVRVRVRVGGTFSLAVVGLVRSNNSTNSLALVLKSLARPFTSDGIGSSIVCVCYVFVCVCVCVHVFVCICVCVCVCVHILFEG